MTQKIYRPQSGGGELQLKVGAKWIPIYGLAGYTVSGGDRETTTFETVDGGVESSVGGAGVKDINLTLNPSFFNAQYNKIIENAYFGNDQITVRMITLAQKTPVAMGGTGDGISIAKINAGYGEEGALTFQKTGEDDAGGIAGAAIKATAELGLYTTGTSTAVATGDRTDTEPAAAKFFICRYDGSAYQASEWKGRQLATALSNITGWELVRHGVAFEFDVRVTTGGNPDISPGAPIGDTLTFQQVASGFKKYPITKRAA